MRQRLDCFAMVGLVLVVNVSNAETFLIPDDLPSLTFALSDPASPVDDGDTLILTSGTAYTDRYTVEIPNLTIKGQAGDAVVLDPGQPGRTITVDVPGATFRLEGVGVTGGGVLISAGVVSVASCEFYGNEIEDEGGAIRCHDDARITIEDSSFRDNAVLTSQSGGAVSVPPSAIIRNSLFQRNSAHTAGAINVQSGFQFTGAGIFDCLFIGNTAELSGGGLYLRGNQFEVSNSRFLENSAREGGAIYSVANRITLRALTVIDNETSEGGCGGGLFLRALNSGGRYLIESCLFAGNSSDLKAAAIVVQSEQGQLPLFTNCTIVANQSPSPSAMDVRSGRVLLWNSIVRGNANGAFARFDQAIIDMQRNNIEGLPTAPGFASNVDLDPIFVDPAGVDGDPFTAHDNDYSLSSGSPDIDAADAAFNVFTPFEVLPLLGQDPRDLQGDPRAVVDPDTPEKLGVAVYGQYADRGAFEYQPLFNADINGDGKFDLADIIEFIEAAERFQGD